MDVAIVIPARFSSTRLPGKPLLPVAGISLLERVWRIAKAVKNISAVYITSDDQRIADHATSFGAPTIMTSPDIQTGTDRVHAALKQMKEHPDAVINLQGDAVLTPPWVVQSLVDAFHADPNIDIVTAAVRCSWEQLKEIEELKAKSPSSGTLVTINKFGKALYFSKNIIPAMRKKNFDMDPPVNRHIGIYGYSSNMLDQMALMEQTPLEMAEQLEQLRALENGIPIQVVMVDYRGRTHGSVDAPEDITFVESVIAREGELVPL